MRADEFGSGRTLIGSATLRLMRYVVIAMLVLIVGSLGSALYFMMTDRGQSDRAVRALTIRVALSVSLFLLLMAGYFFGLFSERL